MFIIGHVEEIELSITMPSGGELHCQSINSQLKFTCAACSQLLGVREHFYANMMSLAFFFSLFILLLGTLEGVALHALHWMKNQTFCSWPLLPCCCVVTADTKQMLLDLEVAFNLLKALIHFNLHVNL